MSYPREPLEPTGAFADEARSSGIQLESRPLDGSAHTVVLTAAGERPAGPRELMILLSARLLRRLLLRAVRTGQRARRRRRTKHIDIRV
jgi:hypothetical protein